MARRRRPSNLTLRDAARAVVQRLQDNGYEAFWAGGCVRDRLLGVEPKDYDVATAAPPDRVVELFNKTRRVGVKFGVVMVRQGHHWIETATFRTDLDYRDGRHPDRVEFTTAEHDAQRRDFTINGIFYDPINDAYIDYVNGKSDLEAGVIRAIGEPHQRFEEDHLRMLRAVRFAMRYGFEIDAATAQAIRELADRIDRISAERIRDELDKMLSHPARGEAFATMGRLDLLSHIGIGDDWPAARIQRAVRTLKALPDKADFVLAMSGILADRGTDEICASCNRLRCSNDAADDMRWLVAHRQDPGRADALDLADFKRLLQHRRFDDLLVLHAAVQQADGLEAPGVSVAMRRRAAIPPGQVEPPPFITGEDLIELEMEPGPEFKVILDELYDAQLNEQITHRDAALVRLHAILARRDQP